MCTCQLVTHRRWKGPISRAEHNKLQHVYIHGRTFRRRGIFTQADAVSWTEVSWLAERSGMGWRLNQGSWCLPARDWSQHNVWHSGTVLFACEAAAEKQSSACFFYTAESQNRVKVCFLFWVLFCFFSPSDVTEGKSWSERKKTFKKCKCWLNDFSSPQLFVNQNKISMTGEGFSPLSPTWISDQNLYASALE